MAIEGCGGMKADLPDTIDLLHTPAPGGVCTKDDLTLCSLSEALVRNVLFSHLGQEDRDSISQVRGWH